MQNLPFYRSTTIGSSAGGSTVVAVSNTSQTEKKTKQRKNRQAYHFRGKSLLFKTCLAKDGNIINVFFEVEEEAECAKLCR